MSNPHPDPTHQFKPGQGGRPLGIPNKTTRLRNKLLDYALKLDLDGGVKLSKRVKGKLLVRMLRDIKKADILKLASDQIPKEQRITGEGFGDRYFFQSIQIEQHTDKDMVSRLNERFSKQFSKDPIAITDQVPT